MATIGNLWINIKANTRGLVRGVGNAKNSLAAFGKFMMNPAVIGLAIVAAAIVVWVKLGKAIVGALSSAVAESKEFNHAMAKVGAVTMKSGDELNTMRQKALDLGRTTVFTASEVAAGQLALAKAGMNAVEVNKAIEASANLASAADIELAESSGILVNVMRAFGLEAESATHIADVLGITMSRTNTTVLEMGEAFAYVAPVARSLGFSVEHVAAMIGVLADAGIKGSMAGTGLRRVMSALASEIEEHGVQALDNWITAQHTVSEDLIKFGLRGFNITQVLALMRDKMLELGQASMTASDIVKSMAEFRMDTLQGDVTKLSSAMSGFKIIVGDELEPMLRQLAQVATQALNAMTVGLVEWLRQAEILKFELQDLQLIMRGIFISGKLAISAMVDYFNEQIREARIIFNLGEILINLLDMAKQLADRDMVGAASQLIDVVEDFEDIVDTVGKGWLGTGGGAVDDLFDEIIKAWDEGAAKLAAKVKARVDESGDDFLSYLGISKESIQQLDEATMKILNKMSTWKDKLQDEMDFPGMETWEINAMKALEVLNDMEGEIGAIGMVLDMIDWKKAMIAMDELAVKTEELENRAQSIFDSVMTPLEIFQRDEKELQDLIAGGFISDETMDRAMQNLKETLEKSDAKIQLEVDKESLMSGFTEGLQTALGQVKVAGHTDPTIQVAKNSLEVQKNMEVLNDAIKTNTGEIATTLQKDAVDDGKGNGVGSLIQKSIDVQKNIETLMNAVKESTSNINSLTGGISSSTSDIASSSGVTASKAGGIFTKLGNLHVGISWGGIEQHITNGVENATLNIPSQSMDYTEHLLEEVRAANWQELNELKIQTAIMAGGGGTPLT